MEKFTKAAIEKFRITLTAIVLISIYGIISYIDLPKAEDPGFIVRAAQVTTYFPGASSQRVEMLVTDKLEEIIQEMPEIFYIKSESFTGVSVITVNIKESYKEMQPIWDKLRRKVERAERNLPKEVIGPYVNDEFGDVFGTIITLTGDGFQYRELEKIADQMRNELLLLPEVAKTDLYGIQDQRVYVEFVNARLAEMGSSSSQLQKFLESSNIVLAGGELLTEREKIFLEPTGNYESVEDIENTTLYVPSSDQVIYLKDLADVSRGYVDPFENKVFSDQTPAIALAVSLRVGGNVSELGKDVLELLDRMRISYPIGVEFDVVMMQSEVVEEKIDDFVNNIFQSIGIVLAIMLIVFGLRTGMIVASLIPMTILTTFVLMSVFSVWIDQISLAALIIALGMLVDNAIVMTESIIYKVTKGETVVEGAMNSAKELWVSLLTSSLTTSAAFLPIYLAKSAVGEYTNALFKVVTMALLSSWVISFTVIPLLCFYILKVKPEKKEKKDYFSKIYPYYRRGLLWICKHRKGSLLFFAVLFGGSMYLYNYIPNTFFPPNDRAMITMEFEMPSGTNINTTEKVVEEMESWMAEHLEVDPLSGEEGVTSWISFVGGNAPRYTLNYGPKPNRPEKAYVIVNTTSYQTSQDLIPKMEAYAREAFPELRLILKVLNYGTQVDAPIGIRVSGRELDEMYEITKEVKNKLQSIPGVKNVRDDWGERTKKIVIDVDQARALRAGITNRDVAISLQTNLSGFETTDFREDDKLIPIVLRSVEAERESIDKIKLINIYSQDSDASVPLLQIAEVRLEWEPSKIYRRNRLKTVEILAEMDPGMVLDKVYAELFPWLNEQEEKWPFGYFWEVSGEREESNRAQKAIAAELPIAGLVILMLLIIQFNSFRLTSIVLLTIPLSLIGVTWGLFLTQTDFGFMSFLGVISLAGIIINNGIVLLEQIKQNLDSGNFTPPIAVLNACQLRLRPILLTTFTTIGGLTPLLFDGGMFEQMAVVIVSGLVFGGALTLGFVPLLYSSFYKISYEGVTEDQAKI